MPTRSTTRRLSAAALLALTTSTATAADSPPPETDPAEAQKIIDTVLREEKIDPEQHPEFTAMLTTIARGGKMGARDGWFGPGQSRYDWEWLAGRFDADGDGAIRPEELTGPDGVFAALDRDRSGAIQVDDLDWSDESPFVKQQGEALRLFRRMDRGGDGHLDREDWVAFFEKAAGEADSLTPEGLQAALNPPSPPMEWPAREVFLAGLRSGEVGSRFEGPAVGDAAPDFELMPMEGKGPVRLSDHRGRPVVLVFGNFTCGPWRARFGAVDALGRKYADRAAFLNVYVREAHPTDGWRMTSNDKADVAVPQPRTDEERRGVAARCREALKMHMPMLVDGVDDRVGNAYSGMPSRLYVIDADGRVVYKSGRGPFGFKPGEMEQALLMLLLDQPRGEPVS